ncbi:hypothetical protein GUITHDRAFT_164895 [Guillardia theta CCMP2712]|uniref:Uncharacterized protein n=2 Tax=Guillardia theta TaxID=55529 RepID=L1ITG6_GUITC|nr:hypothetical protein GUITHDRAFT_164895 [Guillardia theta CCMP2712]EKX39561.1 hypothetical protein GUITHDRAFT_164895 [Guillardia theta CCMP2712]|eukprot:XP_005826541.1 hypothetical protein GUITHDRAFT_164895 [Guillardia theta CCMP2712]
MKLQLLLLSALLISVEGFSGLNPLPLTALRARACTARPHAWRMQATSGPDPDKPDESGASANFDMSALNARISKLKEREANPVLNLQDKVSDALEPMSMEAMKLKQKIPDPRGAIPVTGLPKWVLPLSLIVGLSVFSAIVQSTSGGSSDVSGLASGSF